MVVDPILHILRLLFPVLKKLIARRVQFQTGTIPPTYTWHKTDVFFSVTSTPLPIKVTTHINYMPKPKEEGKKLHT